MDNNKIKKKAFTGVIWNTAMNLSTQLVAFIIQIVLARIIDPAVYGTIALVTIFVAVANVFVTTGYASALIQRKEITDTDCSTSFYIGLGISAILYTALFFGAPLVSAFYDNEILTPILRIQALTLIFGALNSVNNALITRELQFKKLFIINLSGITAQGVVGITMAILGYGVWALVASYTVNKIVVLIITFCILKWKPKLIFSFSAFKNLFSFSNKILILTLIDTLFINMKSLIIGKKYNEEALAFYNRGNQIPSMVTTDVLGSINDVLFPTLSRFQDSGEQFKLAYRNAFRVMFFMSFPIYFGLLATAEPITILLLTEKWRPSIIFMQFICIIGMFNPFSLRSHVYNAKGRSDASLWVSIADKVIITITLVLAVMFGDLYILVLVSVISSLISVIIGLFVNRKVLNYSLKEQAVDFLPPFLSAVCMFIPVYAMNYLPIAYILKLPIQVISGVAIYVLESILFKLDSFRFVLEQLKMIVQKK